MPIKRITIVASLGLFMLLPLAHAYFDLKGVPTAEPINGISFETYKDFEKKWHLVTVRFRKDTGELRFVYANDLAWKEMSQSKPKYADGAVFAKIGFSTEDDPSFPSSTMPGLVARYQFMVHDQKKYSTSDGWGYALFDGEGRPFQGSLAMNKDACAACHRLVPERDFVFARPFHTGRQSSFLNELQNSGSLLSSLFRQTKKADLPVALQSLLPAETKTVDSIEGKLQKTAFAGTLEETIPLLTERAKQAGRSAVLVMNKTSFSLVTPNPRLNNTCQSKDLKAVSVIVHLNGKPVRNASLCL